MCIYIIYYIYYIKLVYPCIVMTVRYIPFSGLFSKNKFSAKSAIIGGKQFRMLLFSANQVLDQNIRVIITGMCTLFPDTSHSTQFNCGF